MNVKLVGYSQDVDLEDPKKAVNYLIFKLEDDKEVRVKVSAETIVDLVMKIETSSSIGSKVKAATTMVVDDEPVVGDDGVASI